MNFSIIFKRLGLLILAIVACIAFYLILAILCSVIEIPKEKTNSQEHITAFILSNGVHTDIVVPIKTAQIDWSQHVKFEHTSIKDSSMNYIALGWGDKGFYLETPTWSDLKVSTAWNAMFGLSSTAMHTTFYKDIKEGKFCKKITLSKEQYLRLIRYVNDSFQKTESGIYIPIRTHSAYNQHDAFYEAEGSYHLFKTCNTWTNNALKICGQKACLWTPFDKGILYHYQ